MLWAGMSTVGDEVKERSRPLRPGGLDITLSILVAFNSAVAQPILDLTGRFPQFFLARRAPRVDLVILAVGLAIVVPAVVAMVVWVVGRIHHAAGTTLHVLVVGSLAATLGIQVLERLPGLRSTAAPLLLAAAVVTGAVVVLVYYRSRGVRRFVRIVSVSALVLPTLFLMSSPASRLVLRQTTVISGSAMIGNPAPVVMLLLDELPIASLMGPDGGIDAQLFPNFARLAAGSHWFRNATAVHDFTEIAVPSILTGSYGDKHKLPIPSHYPKNIFTLLGGAYQIRAFEAFTQLCPISVCTAATKPAPAFLWRWRAMLSDLRIIYGHVVAPPSLEDDLPSIDQTWSDFGGTQGKPASDQGDGGTSKVELAQDPMGDFRRFTNSIQRTNQPTVWFAHIELPHAPWRFLPSGQEYPQRSPIPGRTKQVWGDDEWLLTQAYQRHLLQLAAVDRQLGVLLDRLKSTGIYDRALVLLGADHGVSFRAGSDLRVAAKETVGEIAAVPLFVKLPGQTKGAVSDRPVETFDIVPTIADVLDVEGMYPTDGVTVFSDGPAKTHRELRAMRGHRVPISAEGKEKYAVVARKLAIFGRSGGLERLYDVMPGPYASLLGRTPSGGATAAGRLTIDSVASYSRFDPSADVVRCLVTGSLSGLTPSSRILALAVRGKVVALTRTFVRSGDVRFQAVVAPEHFRRGANPIAVYLVEGTRASPTLRLIQAV